MKLADESQMIAGCDDPFASLVEILRKDFRRLFPHLRPREDKCFFVEQCENKTSGKVWIDFIKERDGQRIQCRITIVIEDNRAVRRIQEETEPDESLENTSFICP